MLQGIHRGAARNMPFMVTTRLQPSISDVFSAVWSLEKGAVMKIIKSGFRRCALFIPTLLEHFPYCWASQTSSGAAFSLRKMPMRFAALDYTHRENALVAQAPLQPVDIGPLKSQLAAQRKLLDGLIA